MAADTLDPETRRGNVAAVGQDADNDVRTKLFGVDKGARGIGQPEQLLGDVAARDPMADRYQLHRQHVVVMLATDLVEQIEDGAPNDRKDDGRDHFTPPRPRSMSVWR